MMAKYTFNSPKKNIKGRWTIEAVAKIIPYFRYRKQNKGEQKTLTNVVPDPGRNSWLKTIENDLKQMRKMINKSEWIKFMGKNLYEWYKISKLSKNK